MKTGLKLRGLLALILILCLAVFTLAACDNKPAPDPTPDPGTNPDPDPEPPVDDAPPVLDGDVLTLIYKGKVNFQVVKTAKLGGSEAIKSVNAFMDKLEALGIDAGDAVADSDAEKVKDCEIVIGAQAQNRGSECSIDTHDLGTDGYVVKVVGQRVIIAGGSDAMLARALDRFVSEILGVKDTTATLKDATVSLKTNKVIKQDTYYDVTDIRVGDDQISLKKFYLEYDAENVTVSTVSNSIRNEIYKISGIWLPLAHEAPEGTEIKLSVKVRLVSDAGDGAFRSLVDEDGNLIVECSFENGFGKGVDAFLDEYVYGQTGVVRIYADEVFNYSVNAVRYTEFGAKGDGRTDDTIAILKTHEYANLNGMKVVEDQGLTYYLGEASYGIEIPIMTDVDFGEATFIIDDQKLKPDTVYGKELGRNCAMFCVVPSAECRGYSVDKSVYAGMSLSKDEVNESMNIGMTFDTDVMLLLAYRGQKIYIRWGANANDGGDTHEMIIVDKNGNLDPTTPLTYDYPTIDYMTAYSIEETPITISGGKFITYACQLCYEFTNPTYVTGDQYYYYNRSMEVNRANVTIKGMEHYVEKESATGGYPYNGWFNVTNTYNTLIEDCIVTARRAYIEDRDTDGDGQPNHDAGTTMGSYDLIGGNAINIVFKDVKQSNSVTSTFYWGIMGSNYCRNITYDGCNLSRFDAHCGVYNATLKDTTIGFDINLIGHGEVLIENVTKMSGNSLISLRVDYGATWNGTITVKNATMYGYSKGNFGECGTNVAYADFYIVDGTWQDHEFGNECTLPNIIVDGFKVNGLTKRASLSFYGYSLKASSFQQNHKNYLALPEFVELRNADDMLDVYYVNADAALYLQPFFVDKTIEDRTTGEKKIKLR